MTNERPDNASPQPMDLMALDKLTGGAFTAPTTGERAARVRDWLLGQPAHDLMAEVYKELSHRDKGAARPLKDRLDELRRAKMQEGLVTEWATRAQALLDQPRFNVADAMAWQRDAAKAGAPLSREPLAALKSALAERIKSIDDLQHRIQVAREAAVLLAQRIEVLSTKPLEDSTHVSQALGDDVAQWQAQAQALAADAQWPCLEPRFVTMLESSRTQLSLVWDAFDAALKQAVAALSDPTAPLPAVPVWADAIRQARGEEVAIHATSALSEEEVAAARAAAAQAVAEAAKHLSAELEQGHTKALHKLAADLRQALKEHGRWLTPEVEGPAQALLGQAGDMEGWQRWRADQLRQELVAKAEALTQSPEGQRMGGRKMQETLRALRESWKQTDQGGVPNHALWRRFDEACNQAHKVVEGWLAKLKTEAAEHRAHRLTLIEEVKAWAQTHATNTDWKVHLREISRFAETWRTAGHLGEKAFAEIQPLWKAAMDAARAPLEAAQAANLAQRQSLIARAQELANAAVLRIDAVKALQQEWQHLAQAVPLERKQEQKLWDAFRKPLDDAFQRKDAARTRQMEALSEADQQVMTAVQALRAACDADDAQRIQAALAALDQAGRSGSGVAPTGVAEKNASTEASPQEVPNSGAIENEAKPVAPTKKLVAVRGDDRPGMKKAEPTPAAYKGRPGPDRSRPGEAPRARRGEGFEAAERGPRLGDAAFRARRDAMEHAQAALRKLAAQAHGQALTRLMDAWKARDPAQVPSAGELGGRVTPTVRQGWMQALGQAASSASSEALLRLEMAAEVPTPAAQLDARRALQLQLLTRRNEPLPVQTWSTDAARVLGAAWDDESARRLQQALKVLMRKS